MATFEVKTRPRSNTEDNMQKAVDQEKPSSQKEPKPWWARRDLNPARSTKISQQAELEFWRALHLFYVGFDLIIITFNLIWYVLQCYFR